MKRELPEMNWENGAAILGSRLATRELFAAFFSANAVGNLIMGEAGGQILD